MASEGKLIALVRITCDNHHFFPGDELPHDNPLVDEWVNGGAAVWQTDELITAPKAKPATAQAGLEGVNVINGETTETLIGKVPVTEARKKPTNKKSAKKRITGE